MSWEQQSDAYNAAARARNAADRQRTYDVNTAWADRSGRQGGGLASFLGFILIVLCLLGFGMIALGKYMDAHPTPVPSAPACLTPEDGNCT